VWFSQRLIAARGREGIAVSEFEKVTIISAKCHSGKCKQRMFLVSIRNAHGICFSLGLRADFFF